MRLARLRVDLHLGLYHKLSPPCDTHDGGGARLQCLVLSANESHVTSKESARLNLVQSGPRITVQHTLNENTENKVPETKRARTVS